MSTAYDVTANCPVGKGILLVPAKRAAPISLHLKLSYQHEE
jgi:hypothetical protein